MINDNTTSLAIDWFERAKPCTTSLIHKDESPKEPDEVFQSRVLPTALYEFVREMPKKVLERRDEFDFGSGLRC